MDGFQGLVDDVRFAPGEIVEEDGRVLVEMTLAGRGAQSGIEVRQPAARGDLGGERPHHSHRDLPRHGHGAFGHSRPLAGLDRANRVRAGYGRLMRRFTIAALALGALLGMAVPAQAANRWIQKRAPLNIAHQGGEDEFPSNTLYAFRKAVRVGADMLELDVGVTKDNQVIVMHDTTVDGKTNGTGNVSSLTLRQIKRLDAAYWFAPAAESHYSHGLPALRLPLPRRRHRPPRGRRGRFRAPTSACPPCARCCGRSRRPRSTSRSRAAPRRGPRRSTCRTPTCWPSS